MKRNRDYFSWSQYSTWKSSKRGYYRRYVVGDPSIDTKYYWKGKQLMKAIEFGYDTVEDADPALPLILQKLPHLEIIEDKMVTQFPMTDTYDMPIVSYVDSATPYGDIFYEYKTGKNAWTQDMAEEKDSQMCFYATMYYLNNGVIPKAVLYWIETYEKPNGTIFYTGQIEYFEVQFTKANVNSMTKRIRKAIIEIEEYEYYEMELDKVIVHKYMKAKKKLDKQTVRVEALANQIFNELKENEAEHGASEYGRFSLSERRTWLHSEKVGKLKDAVKKQVKQEIEDGTAVESVSEHLRFKQLNEL